MQDLEDGRRFLDGDMGIVVGVYHKNSEPDRNQTHVSDDVFSPIIKNDQGLKTYSKALEAEINHVENVTPFDYDQLFDSAGLDPSLPTSDDGTIFGYKSGELMSSNHPMDRYGERFMGVNPDMLNWPGNDVNLTITHEGVHAAHEDGSFLSSYREADNSLSKGLLLKELMDQEDPEDWSSHMLAEAATEEAAQDIYPGSENTLKQSYGPFVDALEYAIGESDQIDDYNALIDKKVEKTDYSPKEGYAYELGEVEVDGEKHTYMAEVEGLNEGLGVADKVDEALEYLTENESSDEYHWVDDEQSVYVNMQKGSVENYEEGDNGFENPVEGFGDEGYEPEGTTPGAKWEDTGNRFVSPGV